jgi:hypothetical protein
VASKRRETHIASCSNIQKAFFVGFVESDGHLSLSNVSAFGTDLTI